MGMVDSSPTTPWGSPSRANSPQANAPLPNRIYSPEHASNYIADKAARLKAGVESIGFDDSKFQSHCSSGDESVAPIPDDRQFLADALGYEVEGLSARRIPWCLVVVGVVALLAAIIGFCSTLYAMRTVHVLSDFFVGMGTVAGGLVHGTAYELQHDLNDVRYQLTVIDGLTITFIGRAKDYQLRLPEVDGPEQEEWVNALSAGISSTALPWVRQLNGTLHEAYGVVHNLSQQLVGFSTMVQDQVLRFEADYNRQARKWAEQLEPMLRSHTESAVRSAIASVMVFQVEVRRALYDVHLGRVFKELGSLSNMDEVPGGNPIDGSPVAAFFGSACWQEFGGFFDTPSVPSGRTFNVPQAQMPNITMDLARIETKALEGIISNVSTALKGAINISMYIDPPLRELRAKTLLVQELDANMTQLLKDLTSLDEDSSKQAMSATTGVAVESVVVQARREAVQRITSVTALVKAELANFTDAVQNRLDQVLARFDEATKVALDFGSRLDAHAKEVEKFPQEASAPILQFFDQAKFVGMLKAFFLAALLPVLNGVLGWRFANMQPEIQTVVSVDKDALRGLCAFHPHVADLDTTDRDRLVRPIQRFVLRARFLVRFTGQSLVFALGIWLLNVVFLVWSFDTLIDAAALYVAVSVAGDMCAGGEGSANILVDEAVCSDVFNGLSTLLHGYVVLPNVDCGSSNLLLCRDFLWPMQVALAFDGVALVVCFTAAFAMACMLPGELTHRFTTMVEICIDKLAAAYHNKDSDPE